MTCGKDGGLTRTGSLSRVALSSMPHADQSLSAQKACLSHNLWVVTHCKEVFRTTATGKLLLLAHPRATLLVSGVPEHESELAELCTRPTAALLYPAADALTPAELLRRHRQHNQRLEVSRGGCGVESGGESTSVHDAHDGDGGGSSSAAAAEPLDLIVIDGTWNQARAVVRKLPAGLTSVVVDCSRERSLFGTAVRRQGAEREAAGRVSTLEAYAHLALALGDCLTQVRALLGYQRSFVGALAGIVRRVGYVAHATGGRTGGGAPDGTPDDDEEGEGEGVRAVAATSDAGGGEDGCRGSIHTSPPPPPPPPRTPTNQLRRRARGLSKELSVGAFSREGRERLADFLEARPALAGAKLLWRVEGSTQAGGVARLVKSLKAGGHAVNAPPREDEVIGSWPLSELLDLSGGRTCDD